ncbi:MAG: FAD-dependent oxidoreductase [Jatrophihabitantaceae bacterium]
MSTDVDVVIVGAGLAGAAAAWSLSRRGRSVVLLEQFTPGHSAGSSHGSARIVRRAYGDALYTRLTGQAFELWREVEQSSGETLLRMHGGVDFGPRRNVPAVAAHLAAAGVPHSVLPASEAAARWPGMKFDGDVLFHAQAGTLDSALAVSTMVSLAAASGAQVRYSSRAVTVSSSGVVGLDDGPSVRAGTVVVAAGAWLAPLLSSVVELPPLRVTQQQVFHFPRRDPSAQPWPSVIHESSGPAVYHLAGGRDGGAGDDRKVGVHDGGVACTADSRSGTVNPQSRSRVVDYVRRWLPGLAPTPRSESTCLYTETPTEDFILDRVGPVVVCSPCSGHGAKFAPLIGELVASLVSSSGAGIPDRFRLASHAAGRIGSVSL